MGDEPSHPRRAREEERGGREGEGRRERVSSWGLCERGQAALILPIYMMLGLCLLRSMIGDGLFWCAVGSSCGTRGTSTWKVRETTVCSLPLPPAASMQHGNGESVWIQGGGGVGETQVHQHSAFSPFASVSLCVSLSDYLLLSLRAAVFVSQNGEGARLPVQAAHEGPAGEGGDFQWAHAPCFLPTIGSPSLGLTRLHPHRLRPFYLRFTSQLPQLCKTRGTR